jgi:multiple sugar transport system permease protein
VAAIAERLRAARTSRARLIDLSDLALTTGLVGLAALWLLPIVWMVMTSLKGTEDIVKVPPEWIPTPPTLAHYQEVLFSSSRTARIGRAFLNSLVVGAGATLLVLMTSALTAYPLARMRFPGRDLVFSLIVASLMIPGAVVLVPQYVLTQRLGWLSTYQGITAPLSLLCQGRRGRSVQRYLRGDQLLLRAG